MDQNAAARAVRVELQQLPRSLDLRRIFRNDRVAATSSSRPTSRCTSFLKTFTISLRRTAESASAEGAAPGSENHIGRVPACCGGTTSRSGGGIATFDRNTEPVARFCDLPPASDTPPM